VTISASRTMGNPTNAVDGQRVTFHITQGGSGGNKVTWQSQYKFGSAGVPTLSSAKGGTSLVGFIYNAALGSWLCVGAAVGF
jgi:hypothetical protein